MSFMVMNLAAIVNYLTMLSSCQIKKLYFEVSI